MDHFLYVDPSTWCKRHVDEPGTPAVDRLFNALFDQRPSHLLCSRIGIWEVAAALQRRRNDATLSASAFNAAHRRLLSESSRISLRTVYNRYIDESLHCRPEPRKK